MKVGRKEGDNGTWMFFTHNVSVTCSGSTQQVQIPRETLKWEIQVDFIVTFTWNCHPLYENANASAIRENEMRQVRIWTMHRVEGERKTWGEMVHSEEDTKSTVSCGRLSVNHTRSRCLCDLLGDKSPTQIISSDTPDNIGCGSLFFLSSSGLQYQWYSLERERESGRDLWRRVRQEIVEQNRWCWIKTYFLLFSFSVWMKRHAKYVKVSKCKTSFSFAALIYLFPFCATLLEW